MKLTATDTLIPAPKDGEDGDAAVTYQLIPSVTQLKTNATRTISTSCTVTAYKIVGGTRTAYNGLIALVGYDENGVARYSTTGNGSVTFSTNTTGTNNPLCVRFECILGVTGEGIVARCTVPVVMDGAKGESVVNALPVPAGEYDATVTYTNNGVLAPYVLDGQLYYVLKKVGAVKGVKPSTDVANNGGNWLLFEGYTPIFTQILMANLGLIGKAVFHGNYMFSQYGKRGNTVINTPGQYSAPTEAGGDFTPNILIDFLTGFLRCMNAEIKGTVNADAGYFGNLSISGDKFEAKDGKLYFGVNNNSYTCVSTTTTELARNANIYLSNEEGGYGIYAHARNTALKLIGANAIDSDGTVTFRHTNTRFVMNASGLYFFVKHNDAEVEVFHLTPDEMLIGNRMTRLVLSSSDTAGNLKVYTYNGTTWSLKKTL
ncbi:MAG: hypothetical protein IJP75_10670 [Bacteroidaceae bacterium]|nr:hypothetical protein [Bacteroidaceae bacterium]